MPATRAGMKPGWIARSAVAWGGSIRASVRFALLPHDSVDESRDFTLVPFEFGKSALAAGPRMEKRGKRWHFQVKRCSDARNWLTRIPAPQSTPEVFTSRKAESRLLFLSGVYPGAESLCANRIARYDVKNLAIRADYRRQRVVRDRLSGTDVTDTVTHHLDAFSFGDELNHRWAGTYNGQ